MSIKCWKLVRVIVEQKFSLSTRLRIRYKQTGNLPTPSFMRFSLEYLEYSDGCYESKFQWCNRENIDVSLHMNNFKLTPLCPSEANASWASSIHRVVDLPTFNLMDVAGNFTKPEFVRQYLHFFFNFCKNFPKWFLKSVSYITIISSLAWFPLFTIGFT